MPSSRKTWPLIVLAFLLAAPSFARTHQWPKLPTAFVSGRPATAQDVKTGKAVFRPMPEDESGTAATVKVPQYALWTDREGRLHRAVVVQAEKLRDGSELVALRRADGEVDIVPATEVKLLGSKRPPK